MKYRKLSNFVAPLSEICLEFLNSSAQPCLRVVHVGISLMADITPRSRVALLRFRNTETIPRGVTRLDGARGKKQVWRPHVRT